jgi:hypothetical protein
MIRIETMPTLDLIYNVRPEEYASALSEDERPELDSFVWSVQELPPAGSQAQERVRLFPTLVKLIQDYLAEQNYPKYNDILGEVFGEYSVSEHTGDRELRFFLDLPEAITPLLLSRIQHVLRAEYPLWRVVAQYEGLQLGVYPEGIRIGEKLIPGLAQVGDPELAAWCLRAKLAHETQFGPLRRQLAELRGSVPRALPHARRQGFAPVAAYDRHRFSLTDADPRSILWVLLTHEVANSFTLNLTANGQPMEKVEHYPVSDEGVILPERSLVNAPYELCGYLPGQPADRFEIALKRGRWPILGRARIEAVTTDHELVHRGHV